MVSKECNLRLGRVTKETQKGFAVWRGGAPFPSLRNAASAVNALPVFVDCVIVYKSDQDGSVAAAVDADMRRAAVSISVMAPLVSRSLVTLD